MDRAPAHIYRNLWVVTLVALAFTLGLRVGEPADTLEAQGRQPTTPANGPKPAVPAPGDRAPLAPGAGFSTPGVGGTSATGEGVVYTEGNQVGMGANGILAVTGSYGIGTSVLYVVDTVNKQLAVYEARGGASSSRKLFLVGARRIDLDLQLLGYNDASDYLYEDLEARFARRAEAASDGEARK